MKLADALIADLTAEAALSYKVLEAVPEDRFGWKPHEKSMSLGQLASHIAETPAWIKSMIEPEMDFASMGDWKPFVARSRRELLDGLATNNKQALAELRGRDDAFLQGTWIGRMGAKELMRAPRHEVIRQTILHHAIQHRGQLTVYLRLCNVPVPQTYGPTADFPQFG
jgi:uncharacterized damage-inducible protein DinB